MSYLQKRALGLPVWVWGAILIGGVTIGLILRYRSKSQADATAAAADATAPTTTQKTGGNRNQRHLGQRGVRAIYTPPGGSGGKGKGGGGGGGGKHDCPPGQHWVPETTPGSNSGGKCVDDDPQGGDPNNQREQHIPDPSLTHPASGDTMVEDVVPTIPEGGPPSRRFAHSAEGPSYE